MSSCRQDEARPATSIGRKLVRLRSTRWRYPGKTRPTSASASSLNRASMLLRLPAASPVRALPPTAPVAGSKLTFLPLASTEDDNSGRSGTVSANKGACDQSTWPASRACVASVSASSGRTCEVMAKATLIPEETIGKPLVNGMRAGHVL